MVVHRAKEATEKAFAADEASAPEVERERVLERLGAFVSVLEAEATRRVTRRQKIERRWLEDLRQYHGVYEHPVQKRINEKEASGVFINLTRPKTDAMMARLWDLLFPTDDRNWSIAPTPVPEMVKEADQALRTAQQAREAAKKSNLDAAAATEGGNTDAAAMLIQQAQQQEGTASKSQAAYDQLFAVQQEAKARADLMQEEIDDQLKTCRYQAEARDVIEDACKIGTGVMKGPVVGDRPKLRWQKVEGGKGGAPAVHVLDMVADDMPAAQWVDPWSFFPDPDARRVEDSEGFYERHLMNGQQLRKLARRADMDEEAIRDILRGGGPKDSAPSYLVDLQDLTGQNDTDVRDLHTVWEYTGPITADQLHVLVSAAVDRAADMHQALYDPEAGEIDPLAEIHCRIWFCAGRVLSFAMHPLDSNEPIYSVFNLFRDETSLYGYGIPYVMRDPQAMLNAAGRMMMDNAALATGPQVVVNKDVVQPQDGKWEITPRKVWTRNQGVDPRERPFETFTIDMNQVELANIMEMARRMIDEMTSMPQIAQGEQGAGVTKTAQGMALLMNSANVVFRRVVRNFDDDATIPLIRRFYHWNMQFSDRNEIKGDYEIIARGSSVLLVREMQANNLMIIAQLFGNDPRVDGDKLKEELFKAHSISPVDILRSDADLEAFLSKQGQQMDPAAQAQLMSAQAKQREVDLKEQELAQRAQEHREEWAARQFIAQLNYDAKVLQVMETTGLRREEVEAQLIEKNKDRDAKERSLAAEIGMARQTGEHAGGSV